MPKKNSSIRNKFNKIIITSVFLTLLIFSTVVIFLNYQQTDIQLKTKINNLAELTKINITGALWQFNYMYINDFMDSVLLDEDVIFISIVSSGENIYSYLSDKFKNKTFSSFKNSRRFVTKTIELKKDDFELGSVHLVISRESIASEIGKRILSMIALLILMVVVIFFVITISVNKLIFSPLNTLKETVQVISKGSLDKKAVVTGNDEISRLAKTFNSMLDNLKLVTASRDELNEEIINRERVEKELKERNEYIEIVLKNMPIGFALNTIDDGVTRYVNKKFTEIYGWPAEKLAKVEDFFQNVFPDPDYRKELSEQVYADMASGDPKRMFWNDMHITRANGEKRFATAINIPLIQQNLMISTVQDTTDRKIAENKVAQYQQELETMIDERTKSLREKTANYEDSQLALSYLMEDVNEARIDLEKANAEMAELNKELESFSYSISHDLRAPLRAIDGFSKILVEEFGSKLEDDAKEYLIIIRDNTQMMGDLINDLLEFSRLSRKNLSKSKLNMNTLALEECNKIKEIYPTQKIDFRISELPPSKGDNAMIKQAFANLISNAVKYSSTRKKSLIEIGCKQEEDKIIYYIKDNGVGFDMKYSHKLFGVFQRLHAVEEFEGTGVGLAIVQRIVAKHGGTVWAESELDKGSTFYFTMN